jgi:hypothetical protein
MKELMAFIINKAGINNSQRKLERIMDLTEVRMYKQRSQRPFCITNLKVKRQIKKT